jgi:hypothetical protein
MLLAWGTLLARSRRQRRPQVEALTNLLDNDIGVYRLQLSVHPLLVTYGSGGDRESCVWPGVGAWESGKFLWSG